MWFLTSARHDEREEGRAELGLLTRLLFPSWQLEHLEPVDFTNFPPPKGLGLLDMSFFFFVNYLHFNQ